MICVGYCFSASLPPMLAAGSLKAINLMAESPEMFTDLRDKCQVLHDAFDGIEGLELSGDRLSPVKHLRLAESRRKSREEDKKLLKKLVLAVSCGLWPESLSRGSESCQTSLDKVSEIHGGAVAEWPKALQ